MSGRSGFGGGFGAFGGGFGGGFGTFGVPPAAGLGFGVPAANTVRGGLLKPLASPHSPHLSIRQANPPYSGSRLGLMIMAPNTPWNSHISACPSRH